MPMVFVKCPDPFLVMTSHSFLCFLLFFFYDSFIIVWIRTFFKLDIPSGLSAGQQNLPSWRSCSEIYKKEMYTNHAFTGN